MNIKGGNAQSAARKKKKRRCVLWGFCFDTIFEGGKGEMPPKTNRDVECKRPHRSSERIALGDKMHFFLLCRSFIINHLLFLISLLKGSFFIFFENLVVLV